MPFDIVFFVVSVIAGSIASISGFGIGSLLTPLLATQQPTKIAVAVVSIPHFLITLVRFFQMKGHLDKRVFIHFGLMSAAGGLLGSVIHAFIQSRFLAIVLAILLLFAGISQLFGIMEKMRFGRRMAWCAGFISGAFGGLVGNQGGIRSAALLGFGLSRDAFVGTATGIALMVDCARMPVYFVKEFTDIAPLKSLIMLGTIGGIIGTLGGTKLLKKIPERLFKKILAVIIFLLGVFMLFKG
jgi:uncharacterized protein